jgi:ABC-type antimicrobial peptide transport system permease subunit
MLPVLIGMAAGLAGAALVTDVMRGLLFGVDPFDPATFAAVSLLLGTIAAVACYVPARRAASVDPVVALRAE